MRRLDAKKPHDDGQTLEKQKKTYSESCEPCIDSLLLVYVSHLLISHSMMPESTTVLLRGNSTSGRLKGINLCALGENGVEHIQRVAKTLREADDVRRRDCCSKNRSMNLVSSPISVHRRWRFGDPETLVTRHPRRYAGSPSA